MATDILYFDYWTRGIRHFVGLDQYFKKERLATLLVHVGAQRGEPLLMEQELDGIRCHDLALYSDDLVAMLKVEKPKVVLLLNNQSEDKIIIRACRNLGIRTIYLMHGMLAPVSETTNLVNSGFGVSARIKRIPKYWRLFLQYIEAARIQGLSRVFDVEIIAYFFRQAISPGGNMAGKWRYADSCSDLALVYSAEDKGQVISRFHYCDDKVIVVGNYNLDDLYLKNLELRDCKVESSERQKYVLYIENGFSDPKFQVKGWTEGLVANELKMVAAVCVQYGYNVKLKLHPSSNYSLLIDELKNVSNIEIIHNCDLAELVIDADVVLGQASTVMIMALAVNKPIGILSIPPLQNQIGVFAERGFGRVIQSAEELRSYFSAVKRGQDKITSGCIDGLGSFIGPFDGEAKLRIARIMFAEYSAVLAAQQLRNHASV